MNGKLNEALLRSPRRAERIRVPRSRGSTRSGIRPSETRLARSAQWANILGLPLALLSVAAGLVQLHGVKEVAERTEKRIIHNQLRIVDPLEGAVVGDVISIIGFSPYAGGSVQVVVTPPNGGDFVQAEPVEVSPTGVFAGHATLGNSAGGGGEIFILRVFYTRTPPGAVSTTVPSDAIFSDPITIQRQYRNEVRHELQKD